MTRPGDVTIPEHVLSGLRSWGHNLRVDGDRLTLTVGGEADLPDLARYLIGQDLDLYALAPQRVSLEDLFVQIVGTDLQEEV